MYEHNIMFNHSVQTCDRPFNPKYPNHNKKKYHYKLSKLALKPLTKQFIPNKIEKNKTQTNHRNNKYFVFLQIEHTLLITICVEFFN